MGRLPVQGVCVGGCSVGSGRSHGLMTVLGSSRWRLSGRVGWGGEPEAERAAQVKGSGSVGTERKELEEEMILGVTKSTPVHYGCMEGP